MSLNKKLFSEYIFPDTRYMGSKRKIIPVIIEVVKKFNIKSVLDAFSGSGCVAFEFKKMGLKVDTNDFLKFCYQIDHAVIENKNTILTHKDIKLLINKSSVNNHFIENTFKGLYFSDKDNRFLDKVCSNIGRLNSSYKRSLSLAALHRACLKKRPRGIFAYTGFRYDDGRLDLKKTLKEHFVEATSKWNSIIFDNGQDNIAYNKDIFDLTVNSYDLVYIDTPYVSYKSDNDYTRRYHFLEGLASYWKEVEIDMSTKTRKIKSKFSRFSSKKTIYKAFDDLFRKFSDSILLVSYYSNGFPSKNEIKKLLRKYKKQVEVKEIHHTYSFGTHAHKIRNQNNKVVEYLFIAS